MTLVEVRSCLPPPPPPSDLQLTHTHPSLDLAEHKKRKQDFSRTSLSRQPPTIEEIANLHAFMLAHKMPSTSSPAQPAPSPKPDVEVVLTRETVTRETALMHPQERNLHGKVFGGYLMRLAYELSYSNTVLFARSPMRFLCVPSPFCSCILSTCRLTI